MVNYRDPAVVEQDSLAVVKLWHAVAGLYIWEFVTTLDFEWDVIRGRRPYRWTIWIYFTTRIATLMAVILCLIGNDMKTRYNCELQKLFQFIFGYLTIATASLLIVLRVVAIWNKKIIITAIATGAWAINVICLIQAIARLRAKWVPIIGAIASCAITNTQLTKLNLIATLATDTILLFIMFIGLLRLRLHERSAFGLGRLLWRQGLIWLLVATIAEVLPVVFVFLNLNGPFNYMFQIPSMVTLSIAATRIYRSLADHATGCTEVYDSNKPDSTQAIEWNANKTAFTPTPVGPVKVAINTTREQDQTLQASQRSLFISVEGQL